MANMSNAFGNIIPKFETGKEIKTEERKKEFVRDLEDLFNLVSYKGPAEVVDDGNYDIFPFTACGRGDFANSLKILELNNSEYCIKTLEFLKKYSLKGLLLEVHDYSIAGYGGIYKVYIEGYKIRLEEYIKVSVFETYNVDYFPEECYEDDELKDYCIEDYLIDLWIDIFESKDGVNKHPEALSRSKWAIETLKEGGAEPWKIENFARCPFFELKKQTALYTEELASILEDEYGANQKGFFKDMFEAYYPKDYRVKLSVEAIQLIKENSAAFSPEGLVESVKGSLKNNEFEGAYWNMLTKEISTTINTLQTTPLEAYRDIYYTALAFKIGEIVTKYEGSTILEEDIFELAHYLELNSYLELKTEWKNVDSFEQARICIRLYKAFVDEAINKDDYFVNDFVRDYNKIINRMIEDAE